MSENDSMQAALRQALDTASAARAEGAQAITMIKSHMDECSRRESRNEKAIADVKLDVKSLQTCVSAAAERSHAAVARVHERIDATKDELEKRLSDGLGDMTKTVESSTGSIVKWMIGVSGTVFVGMAGLLWFFAKRALGL